MLGLEVIKQTLGNNENKLSNSIVKKMVKASIYDRIRINNNSWRIKSLLEEINTSKLSEEEKGQLNEFFRAKAKEAAEQMEKNVAQLFGEDKQASVAEKEEIGKAKEGEASEEAQDEDDDEHKTPAEHVVEQKPGQSVFNY